jgi:hypothetical protein
MNLLNIRSNIRKLANSDYYQTLFAYLKDGMPVKIFHNDMDFTDLQIVFLKYLNFYSAINMDIALGEVSDKVLEEEIYCDAYMMFKNKNDIKKLDETKNNNQKETVSQPTTRWLFKNPSSMQSQIKNQVKDLERVVKQ